MNGEYEQANEQIPYKWYEDRLRRLVFNFIMSPWWFYLWFEAPKQGRTLLFTFAGASVYIIGSILDNLSTEEALKMVDLANQTGIEHTIKERGPLLPEEPKPKDIYGGRKLIIDSSFVAISELLPPLGFGVGIGRTVNAFNNYRVKHRLERAIQISSQKNCG